MTAKQDIPPIEPKEQDLDELGVTVVAGEAYEVLSWSPGKVSEKLPSTQVHLMLRPHPEIAIVLKLKSARALDELVGALLQHRKDVWP